MTQRLARRVAGLPSTVFSEFSALAAKHQAVNLGQGFPDFDGPDEIKQAAMDAIRDGANQYAIGAGALALREAIAFHSKRFYGMTVDPNTMVTVTSGATEAIFDTVMGLVNEGDEVIVFEPFYDSYVANVEMAGGVVKPVLLRPPDAAHSTWWFDETELANSFGPKTKLLMLNTPHNPTGKVYTADELNLIATICQKHDVAVLADEVYEHIAFAPARHIRIATLPGMEERTVTISSAGKSFSFTGWKIGWAIAAPALRQAVQQAHQFVTFASASPLQAAVAKALRLPDSYFEGLAKSYRGKRDTLFAILTQARLKPIQAEGSYFVIADTSEFKFDDDFAFCRWLTSEKKVAAIPPSAFYLPEHKAYAQHLARFAFCKRDETLAMARINLER